MADLAEGAGRGKGLAADRIGEPNAPAPVQQDRASREMLGLTGSAGAQAEMAAWIRLA